MALYHTSICRNWYAEQFPFSACRFQLSEYRWNEFLDTACYFDFQSRRFFAFAQTYDEFSGNIVVNSDLNCCICLKIKKYLMSLPHLPTSANFHQDIILHIQEVHQWRVRLMHSLILVWFLSSFQLPNSQCGKCTHSCHFSTCWPLHWGSAP